MEDIIKVLEDAGLDPLECGCEVLLEIPYDGRLDTVWKLVGGRFECAYMLKENDDEASWRLFNCTLEGDFRSVQELDVASMSIVSAPYNPQDIISGLKRFRKDAVKILARLESCIQQSL